MNLNCHNIQILEKGAKKWQIKFLESNIVMMVADSIVKAKIKNGFYTVV